MAMLEADVNFKVVREFIDAVKEKALGAEVLRSLTPAAAGDRHRQRGAGRHPRRQPSDPATGSEAADRDHARRASRAPGRRRRARSSPAPAQERLEARSSSPRPVPRGGGRAARLARKQLDVPYHEEGKHRSPRIIATNALEEAKRQAASVRASWTRPAARTIDERDDGRVARCAEAVEPHEILFVADAMTGQDAVNVAQGVPRSARASTGIILTKMDGDARGGAALRSAR